MQGHLGLPEYTAHPKTLTENDKPVKIGSRSIRFWKSEEIKPFNPDSENGHVIVVIGAQRRKSESAVEEYVFFLDPNDASIPGEERTMYRMTYQELIARIGMQYGTRITEVNCNPDDAFYAISARQ